MIEIDLYPLEVRYRQRGLRRARILSVRSTRASLAFLLCVAAITYVIVACALLRTRWDAALRDVRGMQERINSQAVRMRQAHKERMNVSRGQEYARRIGELLKLLERSTIPSVSFAELTTRGDVVTLRGESADVSALQALLALIVSEIGGCSATIESMREVLREQQRSHKQFDVTVTLFPRRSYEHDISNRSAH